MKNLHLNNLYPNRAETEHGIFMENNGISNSLQIKPHVPALKRATNNFAIKIKKSPKFLIFSKASITFSFLSFNSKYVFTFSLTNFMTSS